MADVGTLEEQAQQRKAKLKALRSKKSEQENVSEWWYTTYAIHNLRTGELAIHSIYCPPHCIAFVHNSSSSRTNKLTRKGEIWIYFWFKSSNYEPEPVIFILLHLC